MLTNDLSQVVAPERQESVQKYIETQQREYVPFIIKLLIVIGAWMSVLVFTGMSYAFFAQKTLMQLAIGAIFAGGSLALHSFAAARLSARPELNVFVGQLGLAFSLLGKTLLLIGVVQYFDCREVWQVAGVTSVAAAAGYPFWKQSTDRFVFCAAAMVLIFMAVLEAKVTVFTMQYLGMALVLAALLIFWFRKFTLYPVAYSALLAAAFALGSVYISLQNVFFQLFKSPDEISLLQVWLCHVIVPGFIAAFFYFLFKRKALKSYDIAVFAGIFLLAWLLSPQVLLSILTLILGVYLQENKMRNLGYLFFVLSLFMFYYAMHISLLVKSFYLMGTGILLLGARYLMLWRGYAK